MRPIPILAVSAAILSLTACDPFALVEPRPRPTPPPHGSGPSVENPFLSPNRQRQAQPLDPQRDLTPPQPQPGQAGPRPTQPQHPVARRTEDPNFVISPHDPFNRVEITGFSSGELVRDPYTMQIFRVP